MSDLDLIRQLEERLGHPLEEIPEAQFERHNQAIAAQAWDSPNRIKQDSYSITVDGAVNGLFLRPVTSDLLAAFPFWNFSQVKHLYLKRVNLSSFSFISKMTKLTSLDLRYNQIKDISFLAKLERLTSLHVSDNDINDVSSLAGLEHLVLLDLRFNQISDISCLEGLKNLTSLYLNRNEISDFSSLRKLGKLTSLELRFSQISDISWLRGLEELTSLDLSANQISDISWLQDLNELTSLDLSANQISDISWLQDLNELTSLDLSANQIDDFLILLGLKKLKSLDLRNNKISDISWLGELKELDSLDLSSNQISDFSALTKLKKLTSLDLRNNQIGDILWLGELKTLRSLDLSTNQIKRFSVLMELKGLRSLDLSDNQISDISWLAELKGLTSLDLRSNQISDISWLAELKGLTSLDLRSNQISDISWLAGLKGLRSLYLRFNQISDISWLAGLKGLRSLYLRSNQIADISHLIDLHGLTLLDLSSNQVREVPRWLVAGRMTIKVGDQYSSDCINLYKNPIEEPPLEIVRQGNAAILNYYDQLAAQGKDYLYEAKMLIVGEGEAGKTTLAHKIPEPNCPLPHVDDRTRGISICTHAFPCRQRGNGQTESPTFHLNLWDFGGQEIYHATHRFFLSKRSLYVLVADNRKDDTDFNYWLNIIERFAGDSPLIIVLNEKGDVQRTLDRAKLRNRYPDSIKDIVPVNFKTAEEPDPAKAQQRIKDIERLVRSIEHCAENLPHIGEPVPARWVDVRAAIEQDTRHYIYREQFDELCHSQGITHQPDIDTLLGYFHDLGILLHFADRPLLRDRVILKPAWATNAVYRLFDDDGIQAKAGRFSRQDCAALWSDPHYRPMHDVLIELMKHFRLVYEIDDTGDLVAPQLLPENTPTYPWEAAHNSQMQFRYDAFMPKGIFWQLAVALYRYIPNHDWVWRNGMVIQRGNTWAEVTEDLNLRRIFLRFRGSSIAEFRAVIVDELEGISKSYHRLDYDQMIPCQCPECRDSADPHFFVFADLKKRQEQRKKTTIECVKSTEDVPLSTLLDGFDIQAILERVPDKKGLEPTPPEPIDNRTRLALAKLLADLPNPQFEQVLFGLNPPAGLISSEAQGKRAIELLNWLEGPTGKSYPALLEVLAGLGISLP